jgi:hypothetical protein
MSLEFLLNLQEEFFALATWHDAAFRSDTGAGIALSGLFFSFSAVVNHFLSINTENTAIRVFCSDPQ